MRALQVMGGDEWACRRGHRAGTIIVDLARPRVIDLGLEADKALTLMRLCAHTSATQYAALRAEIEADVP